VFLEETDHVLENQTNAPFLVLLSEPAPLQWKLKGHLAAGSLLVHVSNFPLGSLLAEKSGEGDFSLIDRRIML